MQGFGAAIDRCLNDGVGTQVAFAGRGRADVDGAVALEDVQRAPVSVRVHRDRLDAEIAAGADDADGDLAAIREENSREHQELPTQSGLRFSRKAATPSRPSSPARAEAISAAATSPAPPPKALPCTRGTAGFRHSATARQRAAAAAASRTFSSSLNEAARRIQSRSAPALKDLPSPARTTTRTPSSLASKRKA